MTDCNNTKCNFSACGCIAAIIGIVFGALVGVLFAFGLIPAITIVTWIAFGIAILTLIIYVVTVLLVAYDGSDEARKCLCQNSTCLQVGIWGTLITTIAALAITLTPILSIIILIAIGAFFFAFMITSLISLFSCIVCRICTY